MSTCITAYGVYCATSNRQKMLYATTVLCVCWVFAQLPALRVPSGSENAVLCSDKHNTTTIYSLFSSCPRDIWVTRPSFCSNSYWLIKDRPKTSHQTASTLCMSPIDLNMNANHRSFHWVWVANCLHNQTATSPTHFQPEQGNIMTFCWPCISV